MQTRQLNCIGMSTGTLFCVKMSSASDSQLYQMNKANSLERICKYLGKGGDPNVSIVGVKSKFRHIRILLASDDITLLHLASINCAFQITSGSEEKWVDCENLVRAGGRLDAIRQSGIRSIETYTPAFRLTPLDLANHVMNEYLLSNIPERVFQTREKTLIAKLTAPPKPPTECPTRTCPTKTIASSVVDTYQKLLFSSEQSDILFLCEDGNTFPAPQGYSGRCEPLLFNRL